MKKIKILLLIVLCVLTLSSLELKINAYTIEELIVEYTNDDFYEVDGETYDIKNFLVNGDERPGVILKEQPGQRYLHNDETVKYRDNDIVKLIPKELFLENNETFYLGKEYGFYINTFYSDCIVVLIDVEYNLQNYFICWTSVEVNVILCAKFKVYDRDDFHLIGIDENLEQAVVYNKESSSFIDDVTVNFSLENRDYPNQGDENYILKDKTTNTLIDTGDNIRYANIEIEKEANFDFESYINDGLIESAFLFALSKFENISFVNKIGDIVKIVNFFSPPENYYSTSYLSYNYDFGDRSNQIEFEEEFTRKIQFSTTPDKGEKKNILKQGDYTKIKIGLDGPDELFDRQAMNMNVEVMIRIKNGDFKIDKTITSSRNFEYTKNMENVCLGEEYNLSIDPTVLKQSTYLYNDDMDIIKITTNRDDIQVKTYTKQGELIRSFEGEGFVYGMSDGTYIIDFICETAVDFTVLFESHSEHNYGEIYSPHDNTHHKSKCECDMYLLEVHVCKANLNPKYGTCVKCGATVNLGIGPGIIGPTVYHEGKKCVILNNGVLLIIDDDISVER